MVTEIKAKDIEFPDDVVKNNLMEMSQNAKDELGVISRLTFILNHFVKDYDSLKKELIAGKRNIDTKYGQHSSEWNRLTINIADTFNKSVMDLREKTAIEIGMIVETATKDVMTIMTKPVTDEMMNTIKMIGDVIPVDRMTKLEIMTYIESCKGNYLATKAILEKTHADKRYGFSYVSADDMLEAIDKISNMASNIVKNYHGTVFGNDFGNMLAGDYFRTVNTAYDKFMELYK